MVSILATHKKKLRKLGFTEDGELEPDKVLFNLSSRVLTDVEKRVLSKGLKFVLPPKKLSFEKHLLTFEKFYRSISKFSMCSNDIIDSQIFKNTLREIAFKSFKDFKKNVPRNFLCEEELAALENLSRTIVSSLLAPIKEMEWS